MAFSAPTGRHNLAWGNAPGESKYDILGALKGRNKDPFDATPLLRPFGASFGYGDVQTWGVAKGAACAAGRARLKAKLFSRFQRSILTN